MAYKLVLPPDQSGYAVTDGEENLRVQLDGGLGRYRRDIIGAARTVNCQWTVGQNNYQYLRSFYKIISESATLFLIDLYMDSPYLTEHNAHFIPGTMRLTGQSGLTFTVTCQIEVEPIDTSEFDEAFVGIISGYASPDDAALIFALLEKLVNVDLPKIATGTVVIPPDPDPDPEPEPNPIPDNALTDQNANYLVNGSGSYLYGPLYVPPPPSTMLDEDGNRLVDENFNVLMGDFALPSSTAVDESGNRLVDENSNVLVGEFA